VNYFEQIGEKKFRAKQVYEWLWLKHAHTFEAMTNLSKELRTKLNEHFYTAGNLVLNGRVTSATDGIFFLIIILQMNWYAF